MYISSPLKWLGGKSWVVPTLRKVYHQQGRFVDLFCGGGSASFGLGLPNTLMNDINPDLMNFWSHLREGKLDEVDELDWSKDPVVYQRYRTWFNDLRETYAFNSAIEASLFYYLNRMGWRGMVRYNRQGKFNVPYGHATNPSHLTHDELTTRYVSLMTSWTLLNKHYSEVDLYPTDFLYVDPPYLGGYTAYNGQTFTRSEHFQLADFLAVHKGEIWLSLSKVDKDLINFYQDIGFSFYGVNEPRRLNSREPEACILGHKEACS